jgi:spore coat polysaccharide biosynthesis protein SpsF (cytidylyltransferase family)
MFSYVVEAAPFPKIVACPATDTIIMDICRDMKVPFAAHHTPDDVLTRFIVALDKAQGYYDMEFQWVLRLTADCPMLTQELIERFLMRCDMDSDTLYTNRPLDPDGLDMELFPAHALRKVSELDTSPYGREHVTPMLYSMLPVERVRVSILDPRAKISVDTSEEYLLVKRMIEGRKKYGSHARTTN